MVEDVATDGSLSSITARAQILTWHMSKLPVTWDDAEVFSVFSGFVYYLKLAGLPHYDRKGYNKRYAKLQIHEERHL